MREKKKEEDYEVNQKIGRVLTAGTMGNSNQLITALGDLFKENSNIDKKSGLLFERINELDREKLGKFSKTMQRMLDSYGSISRNEIPVSVLKQLIRKYSATAKTRTEELYKGFSDFTSNDYSSGGKINANEIIDFNNARKMCAQMMDKINGPVLKSILLRNLYDERMKKVYSNSGLPTPQELTPFVNEINEQLSSASGLKENVYLKIIERFFPNKNLFELFDVPLEYFKPNTSLKEFAQSREICELEMNRIKNTAIKNILLKNLASSNFKEAYGNTNLPTENEMENFISEINNQLSSPSGLTEENYLEIVKNSFPKRDFSQLFNVPSGYFSSYEGLKDFAQSREMCAEHIGKINHVTLQEDLLKNLYSSKTRLVYGNTNLPTPKEMANFVKEINEQLSSPKGLTRKAYLQIIRSSFSNKNFGAFNMSLGYFFNKPLREQLFQARTVSKDKSADVPADKSDRESMDESIDKDKSAEGSTSSRKGSDAPVRKQ